MGREEVMVVMELGSGKRFGGRMEEVRAYAGRRGN